MVLRVIFRRRIRIVCCFCGLLLEKILFGSDYPHPEGLGDPLTYVDELDGLGQDDVARIMGGNLSSLLQAA